MGNRDSRIAKIRITPVAFEDPPLLNAIGVHEPLALRAIVEIEIENGLVGLGETYADEVHLRHLSLAAEVLIGSDIFATNLIYQKVAQTLTGKQLGIGEVFGGMLTGLSSLVDRVFSPFEVASLDLQGKLTGRPVCDLLGGACRSEVEYSGYLFYKWSGHPGQPDDSWGPALDPDGIVAQARRMVAMYGFKSLKLKGGVLPPDEEAETIEELSKAFPGHPVRIDPNGAWTLPTAKKIASRLEGRLEYLEDPVLGLEQMAKIAEYTSLPLATNMCVVSFEEIPKAVELGSIKIVLVDHHFWGGLRRSQLLAGICDTFGWELSMHSNSHLGVSLAAMTHLAAATPNLNYACDTHWPWKTEDVVDTKPLEIVGGCVKVPTNPGLGVELDADRLQQLHLKYIETTIRSRDDTGYRISIEPDFVKRIW